jgi:hypothetical protein
MLKPVQVIKNFYDDDVKRKLNNWTLMNYGDKLKFTNANNNPPGTSYTTRWTEDDIGFPKEAYDLRDKVIDTLELKNYVYRYGQGIINTVNYPGCVVWEHKDLDLLDDQHIIYHCNIVTKKPKGGETVIEGEVYDLAENDLLCYAVSELSHKVNLVEGDRLRMMWIFGFHIHRSEFYA